MKFLRNKEGKLSTLGSLVLVISFFATAFLVFLAKAGYTIPNSPVFFWGAIGVVCVGAYFLAKTYKENKEAKEDE